MSRPRVVLFADQGRPEVLQLLPEVRKVISDHADLVAEFESDGEALPDDLKADMAVALGGDGTLMSQARRLIDLDIPLVGVNFGRLGFLAEFDWLSLRQHADVIFNGSAPVRERMALHAEVRAPGSKPPSHRGVAINDCAVTAGAPFRMIELRLTIDGSPGPDLTGDGVIVATPVGSTAYNVSAGGPIVDPKLDAIIVTPIAAHSLAFRPFVMCSSCSLRIEVGRANEGTSLVLDGQDTISLREGSSIVIRKHHRKAQFVGNPTNTYWETLLSKMRWAAPPSYRDRGPAK